MIRIPVTPEELTRLIEEEAPGWSKRAAERTKQARRLERFTGPGIWGEVKGVYMKLQHHKCAYCERPMAESPEAKLEYDVEHFRPKSRVTPWPDQDTAKRLRIRYKVRSGAARGYPLLAHDPRNYAVTCKVCNSPLKADHFPIDGRPAHSGSDITKLDAREKPLLLFPLGVEGSAPEELLTFKGIVPVPAKRGGYARKRARVSIDFFRLHLRGELNTGRAHCLVLLWDKLQLARMGTPGQRRDAEEVLERTRQGDFPFAGCARAFLDLHARDPETAEAYYRAAHALVARKEPGLYGKAPGGHVTSV
jgi:hypothetical protein